MVDLSMMCKVLLPRELMAPSFFKSFPLGFIVILILLEWAGNGQLFAEEQDNRFIGMTILRSVNSIRIEQELSGLVEEAILTRTAQNYAEYMVERNHFSHLDLHGRRGVDRVRSEGGTWNSIGEIIGLGPTKDSILTAWMRSTPHKNMILQEGWNYGGAGAAVRGEEILCVVLFARTKSLQARIEEERGVFFIETNDWYERSPPKNYEEGSKEFRYFLEVRGERTIQTGSSGEAPRFFLPEGTLPKATTLLRFGITYSENPWDGKIYHHIMCNELVY